MKKLTMLITVIGTFLLLISCGNSGSNNSKKIDTHENIGSIDSIQIGTQTWATKNLDVSTFRNGDSIPEANISDFCEENNEQKPAWCYYANDPANEEKYGKLYNWYAVNDPRGLAPKGWHVPTDAQWDTLLIYLGGEYVAGGKLKEADTTHWTAPNTGATNETGFSALPGGSRDHYFGAVGVWWSSTEADTTHAWSRAMGYKSAQVSRSYDLKQSGFSVRCLKN
jgi:uncharacterized protein (TIGR02145 family)